MGKPRKLFKYNKQEECVMRMFFIMLILSFIFVSYSFAIEVSNVKEVERSLR